MSQALPDVRGPVPGPRSRDMAARLASIEAPFVGARRDARAHDSAQDQTPIVYSSAQGVNVTDVDGNRYVDLAAGFGALLLGHAPAQVARAVEVQLGRLWLALGDVFASDVKVALCERLSRLLPGDGGHSRVLLGSSGADAVTAAMKTAALVTGRPGIVAFEGGYHGLSHGPLAACGLYDAFREPFAAQLNPHVTFAPYPHDGSSLEASIDAVRRALARDEVAGVLVEPILGRGGCVVPPPGFLAAVRAACHEANAVFIADEIWTGLGRSGAAIASLEAGAEPDIVCLGKGLGSGLPISACIGNARVMAAWAEHGGSTIHTATHFGAPLACAAALASLEALETRDLGRRARRIGDAWMARLREATRGHGVLEVRGRGLMIGLPLEGGSRRAIAVVRRLLERGWIVLTGGRAGEVLTLTPPLDIDESLLDAFAETLPSCLS